jgi:hypothetical protein
LVAQACGHTQFSKDRYSPPTVRVKSLTGIGLENPIGQSALGGRCFEKNFVSASLKGYQRAAFQD